MTWSMSHFLSRSDIRNLEKWKYKVVDTSITTEYYTPFWNIVVKFVPTFIAPNVLTLMGLVCNVAVFSLCVSQQPSMHLSIIITALLFLYQTLDAIDGKHARGIRNGSPIGELWDHACDNVSTIFCAYLLAPLLGANTPVLVWFGVQTAQLVFLREHLDVMFSIDQSVVFGRFSGPGETLLVIQLLTLADGIWGAHLPFGLVVIFGFYAYTLFHLLFPEMPPQYEDTQRKICASLCIHFVGKYLYYSRAQSLNDILTPFQIFCDALPLTIIAGEAILAKMANRQLHSKSVFLVLACQLHPIVSAISTLYYFVAVFTDLCNGLVLPMFLTVRNIYIDSEDALYHGHLDKLVCTDLFAWGNLMTYRFVVGIDQSKNRPEYLLKLKACTIGCRYLCVERADVSVPMSMHFVSKYNIHAVLLSSSRENRLLGAAKRDDDIYGHIKKHGITVHFFK